MHRFDSRNTGVTQRKRKREPMELQGAVWLSVGSEMLGGSSRIALLRAIAEHGSITRAAQAVGLSYKAAWDAVDAMNNLAGQPLVERCAGGRGGGSRLTERGRQLAERFAQIEAAHQRFVRLLGSEAVDLSQDFNLMRMLNMKTSARNQFVGTVSGYRAGSVNDEVELALPGGAHIVAVVTRDSTEQLSLKLGASAFALIKASSVIVATELEGARLSARNQLAGTVVSVHPGVVNAEVVIDIGGGNNIAAVVTQASLQDMGLTTGMQATALFKASSVILGAMI